jgi:hypothetical protein
MQDDIWSEAESDLQANARRRAKEKQEAAKEKEARERAAREQADVQYVEEVETVDQTQNEDVRASARSATGELEQAAYDDDDDLLEAWDAVCGKHKQCLHVAGRGRDSELNVDEVGELLVQLGKPVGCYELQYIVSKVGDESTGRVSLPAFRKWWDDVLREFAEWCATQRPGSPTAQAADGNSSNARQWQTHSSTRSGGDNKPADGSSDSGSRAGRGSGSTSCQDNLLRKHEDGQAAAAAAAAASHLSPEELAASAEQEVEAARAAAVASSHMEAERLRWERHIAEKQRARVMAHRGQQKALEEEAVAKRELVNQITDRLARQVRGKTFVSVLRELGLPVAKGAKGAAVHKAYRRALSIYHPDRATRRGLSWQKVTEAEETYKLLQTQYDLYVAQQEEAQAQMYPQRRRQ